MKTHAWQRTVGALLFLPIIYLSLSLYGTSSMFFFSFGIYISIALTITAGYHRLFSHATYDCSPFWRFMFGFIGTASINSSPVEWSAVHLKHHKFSDTQEDPYDSTWRQFTKFKDRTDVKAPKMVLRLLKSSLHRFWVKNSFLVALLTGLFVSLFGLKAFCFLYAVPVCGYLFTSYLHNIIAHTNRQPNNFPILEFIIPMCGEWSHRSHHENPRINHFGFSDLGGLFIKVIRNDK